MRKLSLFLLGILSLFATPLLACDYSNKIYDDNNLQLFIANDLSTVRVGEPFTIKACVTDANKQLLAFDDIRFDATMPAHKHGMNYRPKVIQEQSGLFRIENILLHMPGRWQLAFELIQAANKQTLYIDQQL